MKAPKNFNAANYIEDMSSAYPLVEQYFCNEQTDLLDSINDLYGQLDIENEIIPLTVIELLER